MAAFAEGCKGKGIDFIVIGDVSSPREFSLSGCDFWSIDRQRALDSSLAAILPERHYSRKNLGYLVAMRQGAEIIVETDDDNFPCKTFWGERSLKRNVPLIEDAGWVNVYQYYSSAAIWPRGFPLEMIQLPTPPLASWPMTECSCPIQQGLADDNPDVDAVYRLLYPLPQKFDPTVSLALGTHSWSPFNSQNTTWFKDAFPLLYLPSNCSFRMTDIWRSFVAQRICWANDWRIFFHGPTVWQERNEHSLLKDFADEVVGYLNNASMCELLSSLRLRPGSEYLGENLLCCYRALIERGLIGTGEIELLEAWLRDISQL
jgi:hypothetical protein